MNDHHPSINGVSSTIFFPQTTANNSIIKSMMPPQMLPNFNAIIPPPPYWLLPPNFLLDSLSFQNRPPSSSPSPRHSSSSSSMLTVDSMSTSTDGVHTIESISKRKKKKTKIFRPWDNDDDHNSKQCSKICTSSNGGKKVSTTANVFVEQVQNAGVNEQAAIEAIVTNLGKSHDGHRCIVCGKVWDRKYGLKIHLRTHSRFKPVQCKVCKRPFSDPSNLNKHTRLHIEAANASFKCPKCDKVLVRKRDLDRHLRSAHID